MKVNLQNSSTSKIQGQKISAKMGIANPAWIIEILSKKLYSRPIYTVIQEYLSNGYDANVKAGRTGDPVIMTLRYNDSNQWYVAFTDFGVGMTENDVFETFAQYGASDKQDSEDQIGMMGLGSKSAFSYVEDDNMFFVKTVKDGFISEYMVKKIGIGEQEVYMIAPPTKTEMPNGTSVWFYVKPEDVNNFVKAAKDRACFIPNMIFDFDESLPQIKQTVFEQEHFVYSPINDQQKEMFVLLGNIPYRINWEQVGWEYRVSYPFAIKLSLKDGVYPTPNREELTYDSQKHAVKIIREKLKLAYGEIISLVNQNHIYEDWKTFLKNKNKYFFKIGSQSFDLENQTRLQELSGVNLLENKCPVLDELGIESRIFSLKNMFVPFTAIKTISNKNSIKVNKDGFVFLDSNTMYYRVSNDTRFKTRTLAYLRHLYYNKTIVFVQINEKYTFKDFCIVYNVVEQNVNANEAFYKVSNFQLDFFNNLPEYENIEVPKSFEFKSEKSNNYSKEKDSLTLYEFGFEYNGKYRMHIKTSRISSKLENLQQCDNIFWCEKEDQEYAENLYNLLYSIQEKLDGDFKVVVTQNKKDAELLKTHFIHVKDFPKHQWAKQIISAHIFNEKLPTIPYILRYLIPNWKEVYAKVDAQKRYLSNICHGFQKMIAKENDFKLEAETQQILDMLTNNAESFEFLQMFDSSYPNKEVLVRVIKDALILNNLELKF